MRAKLVRESLYESEHRDVNNSMVAYHLSDNEEEAKYGSSWTYAKIERGNEKNNNKIDELIERAKKGLHLKEQKDKLGRDEVNTVEYFYNNHHGGVLICRFSHHQRIIYLGNYARVHEGWVVIQQTLDFEKKSDLGVIDEKELDKLITNRNISYANDLKDALKKLGFKIRNLAHEGFIKSPIHKDEWLKKSN